MSIGRQRRRGRPWGGSAGLAQSVTGGGCAAKRPPALTSSPKSSSPSPGCARRLARWLLMMRDRSDEDALLITQSLLAEMLGVQRPTITIAARELERAGLIERGRRQVTILDRQGLTKASCECYQLVRKRIAFHLPKTYT